MPFAVLDEEEEHAFQLVEYKKEQIGVIVVMTVILTTMTIGLVSIFNSDNDLNMSN